MKLIKTTMFAALMLFAGQTYAQSQQPLSEMSDKELSAYFGQKADELNAEIKLVKTQIKGDKLNENYKTKLVQLKNELSKVKNNKSIVDKAIKTQNKADKAIQAAEAAQKKAEEAKEKALKLKKEAEEAARKALYLRK